MEHISTITIPSTRVYMDTVDRSYWKSILDTFICFNAMKEWTYNRMYDSEFMGAEEFEAAKEIRAELDRRYGEGVPGYYVTSIFSTASGMVKSQKELRGLYEKENELRIEHIKDSIKKDTKRLTHYRKVKESIVRYSKALKNNKKRIPKIHVYKDTEPERLPEPVEGKYDGEALYLYELHVDEMIHTLSTRVAQKGHRAFRKSEKDFTPKRVTFGSKAFYKTKDTKAMSPADVLSWHNERKFRRMNIIHISGRHDSTHGNFCCRYDYVNKTITLRCFDGTDAVFRDVRFPYRGEEIANNLRKSNKDGRKSIGYTIELHVDMFGKAYLLFKATLDVEYTELNDYTKNGVISVDLNYDNIAWSELNSDGCRIDGGVISFDLLYGSTGHNKDTLGKACTKIAAICRDRNKPLIMEDLDTQEAKTKMAYGSKKGNAHASVFAFRTMTTFLENKCASMNVGVIKKNPAYTSQSSKLKYMRHMGKSIHEGASVTIGRRGMGFREKVPKYLQHFIPQGVRSRPAWKKEFYEWRCLSMKLKAVPAKVFKSYHQKGEPISCYTGS